MPATSFGYRALDSHGNLVKGTVESDSAQAVAQTLAVRKLTPTEITAAGQGLQREIKLPGIKKRSSAKDLAIVTRQFASMTSAGLSLLRALSILEQQATKPSMKNSLAAVRSDVQHGSTLSAALGEHPDQFPSLMVNMIKAGETGGFLDEALSRIAAMYESDADLRAKIKGAMTYPIIVLVMTVLLGTGVIVFIVPVFERMFNQFGGSLPAPTQLLVTLSHNAWWWAPAMLAVTIGGLVGFKSVYRKNAAFRLRMDGWRLKVPIFGPLFTKIAIARWARNLGTLMHVGVPALQALEVVGGTTGNEVISAAMTDVRHAIRAGHPMSGPLAQQRVFPPMVVQMVEVGEETGQLTEMLEKTAEYYDQEVKTATESLTSAMEPILVLLLGAVVGSMVLTLYLPMFTIYQNIQ